MVPYWNRFHWIEPYIKGKNVLDLGCVDHTLGRTDRPWLHGFIRNQARRVVGVDMLTEAVQELRYRGMEIVQASVEEMDLGERFDVVVAGDILQQLSNPGRMIERAAVHLVPGGGFF
jgi:2-polyprenyl-3-methyl-5-hydroxy-6-metoxy-1,4-benzoquinol methylase